MSPKLYAKWPPHMEKPYVKKATNSLFVIFLLIPQFLALNPLLYCKVGLSLSVLSFYYRVGGQG